MRLQGGSQIAAGYNIVEPGSSHLTYRTRGNGHKPECTSFHRNIRKDFFTVKWQSTETATQRGCEASVPWRHSKSTWLYSWLTYSRWLCSGKVFGLDALLRSLPTLTFHGSAVPSPQEMPVWAGQPRLPLCSRDTCQLPHGKRCQRFWAGVQVREVIMG